MMIIVDELACLLWMMNTAHSKAQLVSKLTLSFQSQVFTSPHYVLQRFSAIH